MKTLSVRFVNGPLDGQSRDIACPPVKFQMYTGDRGTDWGESPWGLIGFYQMDSISEGLGYAVYVWIPVEIIPGCLKPLDAIEFAAKHDSEEQRRFSKAWIDETGKVQWGWRKPVENTEENIVRLQNDLGITPYTR